MVSFFSEMDHLGYINFWLKNTNPFEREVLGMAIFERFEVLTIEQAWDTYKQGNGDPSKESFTNRMQDLFNTIDEKWNYRTVHLCMQ